MKPAAILKASTGEQTQVDCLGVRRDQTSETSGTTVQIDFFEWENFRDILLSSSLSLSLVKNSYDL